MITEKLKQIIQREVAKLPKENQEVINNFGWEQIAEEIGKKHLLSDEEASIFQAETLVVLVGLEDPDYYAQNIENEVGTSKEEARKISDDVFEKIFTPINNILIENIKQGEKNKNANAEQNLDFILSGGDYSAFATPPQPSPKEREELKASSFGGSSEGVNKKTEETILPAFFVKKDTPKTNTPNRPEKITDINPAVRPSEKGSTAG